MLRRKDDKTVERGITLWLEKKGFPLQRYMSLPSGLREALRNMVCIPTRPTTYEQRKVLYTRLCLSDIAGRESINPVDFMPDEELEKFFAPVSETLSYYERF